MEGLLEASATGVGATGDAIGSSNTTDLFITEINSEIQNVAKRSEELLAQVRKENEKVKNKVHEFRSKVDNLVSKQRSEYIQAYENHMQDVQKELHSLREKVQEMANTQTKNERTVKLKSDLTQVKSDTEKLEADSDQLRSLMAISIRKIYMIEKSRDWMLKKLRKAKRRYNYLLKEKSRLIEEIGEGGSITSLSKDSYTVELASRKDKMDVAGTNVPSSRFERGVRSNTVQRQVPALLPELNHAVIAGAQNKYAATAIFPRINSASPDSAGGQRAMMHLSKSTGALPRNKQPNDGNPWNELNHVQQNLGSLNIGNESDLSKLVTLRTVRQELKNFLSTCKATLHKRPWCRVEKR